MDNISDSIFNNISNSISDDISNDLCDDTSLGLSDQHSESKSSHLYLQSEVLSVSKRFNMHRIAANKNNLITQCVDDYHHEMKHSLSCGDDAYFITKYGIGVADGVSGWTENGMASAFSNSLLFASAILINQGHVHPETIIASAYETTKENVIGGSSTVCIAVLNNNILNVGNLGDSGLILIRKGQIIEKTEFMRIDNYIPCQLGKWSINDSNDDRYEKYGSRVCDMMIYHYNIIQGDIIIMATDGIFDNITNEQILDIVNAHSQSLNSEYIIAYNILHTASVVIADSLIKKEQNIITGNIVDDMTVIVSTVMQI